MHPNGIDLTSHIYGRLTVVKEAGRSKRRNIKWLCRCICGNEVIVSSGGLRSGHTQSCGCLQKERTGETHVVHALYYDSSGNRSKLHHIWDGMKQRCLNTKSTFYKDYGGRGITICEEWMDFKPFYEWSMDNGYCDGLTIDRIDNNGNYRPDNCKWATRKEQAANKRSNITVTYNGISKKLMVWAAILGMSPKMLNTRLRRGWSIERAFTQPMRGRCANENLRVET